MNPGRRTSSVSFLLIVALIAAACGGASSSSADDDVDTDDRVETASTPVEDESPDSSGSEDVEAGGFNPEGFDYGTVNYAGEPVGSALSGDRANPEFPPPLVDPDDIVSGGPPPDGIPPIDEPIFAPIDQIDFVAETEPVIAVDIDGEARAYPVQILTWHELVNDEIAGTPVTVAYCPLCNSALAYDRRLAGRVLDFGTSGELYQSSLVMYDRQTESLWAHFLGRGLVGHHAGAELTSIPAQTISFAQFRDSYPDGEVLTRETGHSRPYGTNPYLGYDNVEGSPIRGFLADDADDTVAPMTRIVGVDADDGGLDRSVAVVTDRDRLQVHHLDETAQNLVVFQVPGTSSALDSDEIAAGRDVGQVGVFTAELGGEVLTFSVDGDRIIDDETGSEWSVTGLATEGPRAGDRLTPVTHLDTFWFAWAAYQPGTDLIEVG